MIGVPSAAASPSMGTLPAATPAGESVGAAEAAATAPGGTAHNEAGARAAASQAQSPAIRQVEAEPRHGTLRDFAALLLESTDTLAAPSDAQTAVRGTGHTPDAVDAAALPDQLLALLDGAWMQPAAPPAAAPAPAPPSAGVVQPPFAGAMVPVAGVPGASAAASAEVALPAMAPVTAEAAPTAAFPPELAARDPVADANGPPAGLSALLPAAPVSPAPRAIAAPVLTVPADPQAGFDDGFGARLVWMAGQRLGHAEIRLNPEHLGPIDVRVQVEGSQVTAEFQSGHAAVRQAIEASLPRLRELLEQQGMQLGQADVGQRQAGSGQPGRQDGETQSPVAGAASPQAAVPPSRSRGLVDEYA